MTQFIIACFLTVGISAFCSILESMLLSTTAAEVEALKNKSPKTGPKFEKLTLEMEDTIAAILTLNTIANTAGSYIIGLLAAGLFGSTLAGVIAGVMTFLILIFAEIIPKNMGIAYRTTLQPLSVMPLQFISILLKPFTLFMRSFVKLMVKKQETTSEATEQEIKLLAQKGAKEGKIHHTEASVISNALTLDDVEIDDIMTPRTVVYSLEKSLTVGEVAKEHKNIPFARIPIYDDTIDNVVGILRRRDLLQAMADDDDDKKLFELSSPALFVPDTANGADTLQSFLTKHQQLAVVVDEFGSVTGVVTMEDIIEHILGREIFEKDDVAVDMRELARAKHARKEIHEQKVAKKKLSD